MEIYQCTNPECGLIANMVTTDDKCIICGGATIIEQLSAPKTIEGFVKYWNHKEPTMGIPKSIIDFYLSQPQSLPKERGTKWHE